jgi:membrane-associated protease RseP (regulator of RpoE activity)
VVLIGGLACASQAALMTLTTLSTTLWSNEMHPLHIALHNGFQGDHVVIEIGGRIVFDRTGVTTDLRISRADAVDVEVEAEQVTITVTVLPGVSGSTDLNVAASPYLAVDLEPDGTLRWIPSHEPFRYL